jgi:hypothetical protein
VAVGVCSQGGITITHLVQLAPCPKWFQLRAVTQSPHMEIHQLTKTSVFQGTTTRHNPSLS